MTGPGRVLSGSPVEPGSNGSTKNKSIRVHQIGNEGRVDSVGIYTFRAGIHESIFVQHNR